MKVLKKYKEAGRGRWKSRRCNKMENFESGNEQKERKEKKNKEIAKRLTLY